MANRNLITVLGWEERALLGLQRDFEKYSFEDCTFFCYSDYLKYTESNLAKIESLKNEKQFNLNKHFLDSNEVLKNWNAVSKAISSIDLESEIIIDITTVPRELIWTILFFLKQNFKKVDFTYHKPVSYCNDWLSREPENPRLLLKHSGIVEFDKPTLLFIITGFDPERTRQLIQFYEPKKTVLAIQNGNQFDNSTRNNKEQHIAECIGLSDYEDIEIDVYELETGYNILKQNLDKYKEEYNIVVSSLGPKVSAILLYRYFCDNQEIALSYVPCGQYNLNYSSGIDSCICGSLSF